MRPRTRYPIRGVVSVSVLWRHPTGPSLRGLRAGHRLPVFRRIYRDINGGCRNYLGDGTQPSAERMQGGGLGRLGKGAPQPNMASTRETDIVTSV